MMRPLRYGEVRSTVVKCACCHIPMPYMSAFTDGELVLCGNCGRNNETLKVERFIWG
jgi:hypothetical protein